MEESNANSSKQSAAKLHKCLMCPKTFKQRAHLNVHINTHTKEKPYKCHTCSVACATKANLERHVQAVHGIVKTSAKSKKVKCTQCSYECTYPSVMKVHSRKHSAEMPYLCSIPGCGFKCKHMANLRRHQARLHNHERPFKCRFHGCSYEAKDSGHLRQHFQVHSNARPFTCIFPGCNFAFKTKGNLKTHANKSHCAPVRNFVIRVKPILKCPEQFCNFSSRKPQDLRKHVACRHGDIQFDLPVLPRRSRQMTAGQAAVPNQLVCPAPNCDYQTEYPHRYDHHVKIHDEETRKHTCKFCSMRFPSSDRLETHVLKHTGEKPYRCSLCDYSSAYPFWLRKHAGKAHEIFLVPRKVKQTTEVKTCKLCGTVCMGFHELVLHSMTHLQPVVVLERLSVNIK